MCQAVGCENFKVKGMSSLCLILAFTKYDFGGDTKYILQVPNGNINVNQLKKLLRKSRTMKVSKTGLRRKYKDGLCLVLRRQMKGSHDSLGVQNYKREKNDLLFLV